MPFVARDSEGRIIEVRAEMTETAREALAPDDPELRRFMGQSDAPEDSASAQLQDALISSDLEFIRVLEDLITVLIDKRIIVLTDLPQAAQQKLAQRYELRSKLSDLGGIVGDSEDIPLP